MTLATFELPALRRGGAVPHEHDEIAVRFRVDGVLSELGSLPLSVRDNVAARVKILANLDIAERRRPQGGRIRVRIRQRDAVRDLYSALASLNRRETNIMTAEDPVELHLRGINQVQVRESVGLTIAVGAPRAAAAGPERDHGGGDPRLRDRRDRREGRPHRPPGALDAAHERRPVHGIAPREHGDRAVSGRDRGPPGPGAAAGPADLRRLHGGRHGRPSGACSTPASRARRCPICGSAAGAAARPAAAAATRAGSGSTTRSR